MGRNYSEWMKNVCHSTQHTIMSESNGRQKEVETLFLI